MLNNGLVNFGIMIAVPVGIRRRRGKRAHGKLYPFRVLPLLMPS